MKRNLWLAMVTCLAYCLDKELWKAIDYLKEQGIPGGLGAHLLDTVKACVNGGLKPDFWVKTLHRTSYWSANIQPENDNIWCRNPEETIEYMKTLETPWVAFKVLAAGA